MAVKDDTRKISYSKRQTSQEINLKDVLGRKPTPEEKSRFVEEAVDRIINRTQSGKQLTNVNFKRYSEEYAEQKGVSPSDVDMTLLGDMLESVKELSARGNKVRYGIDGGVDAKKSFNHNTGDTLPKRTWFGLTKKEAKEIGQRIKSEEEEENERVLSDIASRNTRNN